MDLLKALVNVSEKAARIARICRNDPHLFQLLIQEKNAEEANPRFVKDFKTLADVLIQETVKSDIGTRYPELREAIQGEENNIFSNSLGETIHIEIGSQCEETVKMLKTILNDDLDAANALSREVHEENPSQVIDLPEIQQEIHVGQLGIWIDPIDSTGEYIQGVEVKTAAGLVKSGLKCAAVLIGVFDRHSGSPIAGIVNQPFGNGNDSRISWGLCTQTNVDKEKPQPTKTICVSSSEDRAIVEKLAKSGYEIVEVSGAGYKILTVIEGKTDAYILSKNSTYKWDTCGPQAILNALGGDIVNYERAVKHSDICSVKYGDVTRACNTGGIIAYRDVTILQDVLEILQK